MSTEKDLSLTNLFMESSLGPIKCLRSEDGHDGSPPPYKVVLHIILVSHRYLLTFFTLVYAI